LVSLKKSSFSPFEGFFFATKNFANPHLTASPYFPWLKTFELSDSEYELPLIPKVSQRDNPT